MSVLVQIRVSCDEPGCTKGLTWTAHNEGGLSPSRCLFVAREVYGWATSTKVAKCPEHREPLRTHRFQPGMVPDMCYRKVGNGHCWRKREDPRHG